MIIEKLQKLLQYFFGKYTCLFKFNPLCRCKYCYYFSSYGDHPTEKGYGDCRKLSISIPPERLGLEKRNKENFRPIFLHTDAKIKHYPEVGEKFGCIFFKTR